MFTGLVTSIGEVRTSVAHKGGKKLLIGTSYNTESIEHGESIACNGACLTVTKIHHDAFEVEISPDTLSRTLLGELRVGERLHLERALRVGDRLGGHYVSGHIDAIGTVIAITPHDAFHAFEFKAPKSLAPLLVEKGSIAINGVSLTVNAVTDFVDAVNFQVMIIPLTFNETLFHQYRVADKVNLEGDLLGKFVLRHESLKETSSHQPASSVTMDKLKSNGF